LFFAVVASRGEGQERPQLKRPEEAPQEKPAEKKKAKKIKGPRAVGILELNSNGKGTLVPVAILVDGKFYDASAYKADPVPMALDTGTVYEAEEAGDSQGLFTINGALHSKSPGSAHPWLGSGTYLPIGTEGPKSTRKAEDVPVGIDSSGDGPPRLTRKEASKAGAGSGSSGTPSGAAPASAQPAGGSGAGTKSGSDTTPAASAPAADKPGDSSGKQPTQGAQTGSEKGAQAAPGGQAAGQTSSGQTASGETGGDYYRPQLRRGKPTAPAPPDEEDATMAARKDGKAGGAGASSSAKAGPLRMVAAISDAGGPDPQSYKFFWKTGEEEEWRNRMLTLAGDEVRAYAAALARNQILARPVAPKANAGGRKGQTKPVQPVFENIQFRGFDVWLTSQPVMILSAEAHIPAAPGAPAAATEPYSIMLVARTDIYGSLRKLYSGVTDRFHLDVTPRLELIDVVDADGDGRGELLFRETTDAGTGYLIYRATADKLWKMFDSRSEE
jgi:hypothetical protein